VGGGVPIPTNWRKSLALCLLCEIYDAQRKILKIKVVIKDSK
jgi:hypothetical protein